MTSPNEPSYAEADADSDARAATQKPFYKQFQACKTLDKLAALVEKQRATYDTVPWISWICGGPEGGDSWTETRGKPDAKKQKELVRIISHLIKRGAELALVDEQGRYEPHALTKLVQISQLTPQQCVALIELAIEHGADPADRLVYPLWSSEDGPFSGYHVTLSALDAAMNFDDDTTYLDVIRPHVGPGVLEDSALRTIIENLRMSPSAWLARFTTLLDGVTQLDRVVTKLESTSTAALVHFLCEAHVAYEYVDRAIDRLDVNRALPAALTTNISIAWGVVPSVKLPRGTTPLDMLDAILAFVKRREAMHAKKPEEGFRTEDAARIRTITEQKRERFLARGARPGERAGAIDLPPVLAETAAQLLRLAKLVGTDEAPLRDAMAAVDTAGMGPWGFLRAVVPSFETELVTDKLAVPLARLLTAFTTERWSKELRKSRLPSDRRAAAELVIEFDSDAGLLAVKSEGATQIWRLADDEVTVVAPTVPAYLAAEIDRWQA